MTKIKIKNFRNSKKNGFSMIEILIVIAVIGILTGLSWRLLKKSKDESAAINACNEAAAAINVARNYALTGKCAGNDSTKMNVTFFGNNSVVLATDNNGLCEIITLPQNAKCGEKEQNGEFPTYITYGIPNGDRNGGVTRVRCDVGSVSKTVIIDSRKATCQ